MRNFLLNIFFKLKGKDIFKKYRLLKKKEFNSLEDNLLIQEEKLKKILIHCYNNVPYYHRIFEEDGLFKNNKLYLNNFNRVRPLTKKILKNNFEELKSKDILERKSYFNTSGGSTGEPTKFIQDNNYFVESMATTWLFHSFINNFPTKHIFLWGSERDILGGKKKIFKKIRLWFYKRVPLNSFEMSEKNMGEFVKKINKYKPVIIESYAQSIDELAKYIKRNNLDIYSPKGIISSAGTLYPEMRKNIEEVFKTKVYNRYGSREVGSIACSCTNNEGLHLSLFNNYVEILNNKLIACKPGEIGKVYITTLNNYSMPLVKYDIGDMAIPSEHRKCSCGRGLPLIKEVIGREMSVFKTKEGKIIPGEFFIHFVGVVYNKGFIEKFQIIQKEYDYIIIKLILRDKEKFEEYKKEIIKSIKKVMGEDCKIEFKFVKKIEPTRSGKYLYTISEL